MWRSATSIEFNDKHLLKCNKSDLGVKTTLQKIAMHTKINNFLKI